VLLVTTTRCHTLAMQRSFSAPRRIRLDPGCVPDGPAWRGFVRNKPNLHRSDMKGKSFTDKHLWLTAHAKDFGQTKPIHGDTAWDGAWATRAVGCCTNKANSRLCRGSRPGDGGRGDTVQTNPIGRCLSCATKPLPNGAGWDGASGARDGWSRNSFCPGQLGAS